jgi:hypothetical protein
VVLNWNVANFSRRCTFTFFLDVILTNNYVWNFLMKVLEGCIKLESLHIAGAFQDCEKFQFLKDLSKYIPLATNIRDLRNPNSDRWHLGICFEGSVFQQLVAFCFMYPLDYLTIVGMSHSLSSLNWNPKNNGNVASRPCFWHRIGKKDLLEYRSFPRIHLSEFVYPIPYIDSFPVFK